MRSALKIWYVKASVENNGGYDMESDEGVDLIKYG